MHIINAFIVLMTASTRMYSGTNNNLDSQCAVRHFRIPPSYALKCFIENSLIFEGLVLPLFSLIIMLVQYLYLYATIFWLSNVQYSFMVFSL